MWCSPTPISLITKPSGNSTCSGCSREISSPKPLLALHFNNNDNHGNNNNININ